MPNTWQSFNEFLQAALAAPPANRQAMVDELLQQRTVFPWIEEDQATFIYARRGAENVAVNLDRVKADPPLLPMERLDGTSLFYRTLRFEMDDLLDYMLAVNDPLTPLSQERNLAERVRRYWKADPLNSAGLQTPTTDVSVLRMPYARPFPDWAAMSGVPRGNTVEHTLKSKVLGAGERKVWVHTPADYARSNLNYPLLIFQDGQWAKNPLQLPSIVDVLIKHGRMAPVVVAMVQSGTQADRIREYVSEGNYYRFVMDELLPYLQNQYRLDTTNMSIGGVSAGGIAAADVAMQNPSVFNGLLMLSPPLGKGDAESVLLTYPRRFQETKTLPRRIFHAVGRYELHERFLAPSRALSELLYARPELEYRFVELGSGHGLIAFRSILPEALAWTLPGWAAL